MRPPPGPPLAWNPTNNQQIILNRRGSYDPHTPKETASAGRCALCGRGLPGSAAAGLAGRGAPQRRQEPLGAGVRRIQPVRPHRAGRQRGTDLFHRQRPDCDGVCVRHPGRPANRRPGAGPFRCRNRGDSGPLHRRYGGHTARTVCCPGAGSHGGGCRRPALPRGADPPLHRRRPADHRTQRRSGALERQLYRQRGGRGGHPGAADHLPPDRRVSEPVLPGHRRAGLSGGVLWGLGCAEPETGAAQAGLCSGAGVWDTLQLCVAALCRAR